MTAIAQHIWSVTGEAATQHLTPIAILIAGSELHPNLGASYITKDISEAEEDSLLRDRDVLVSHLYDNLKQCLEAGDLSNAKKIAASTDYQCVFVCSSLDEVADALARILNLGLSPLLSDSDEFTTCEYHVVTFTSDYR